MGGEAKERAVALPTPMRVCYTCGKVERRTFRMTTKALTRIVRPQAKGQITIPADFRERLGIDQGTFLQLTLRGSTIEVSPLRLAKEGAVLRDFGREDLDAFLKEDRIDRKTATKVRRLLSGG
jgi:AbrB family looped-hinge helix DNA binding protein